MDKNKSADTGLASPVGHPPKTPSELIRISTTIGNDLSLVQGGGGNTSFKSGDDFWIKTSGTWLADANIRDIFVHMPLEQVRKILEMPDTESALASLAPNINQRPSIETSLHALLPHRAVLHVHSVNTIAWAARIDAESVLAEVLHGLSWAWVPYRRPGVPLTDAIRNLLDHTGPAPDILVLGNHGLVVGGEDCTSAEARLREVETRLALPARALMPADLTRLHEVNDAEWDACDCPQLNAIATDTITCEIAARGALYPDHVVFLGERALLANEDLPLSQALSSLKATGMQTPPYAVVPGAGLLLSPTLTPGARAMLQCLAAVGLRVTDACKLRYLDDVDAAELLGWEAEAFRKARDTSPEHDTH